MWVINYNLGLIGYLLTFPNKNGTVSPSQKELLYFVLQLGELGDSQPFFYFFLILLFMQETETKETVSSYLLLVLQSILEA